MAAFEQRTRDAETKTNQYLKELHTLRAEVAILRAKVGKPLLQASSPKPGSALQASAPSPATDKPAGGCDDCGQNGSCPCVDSYLESTETTAADNATTQRQSMSIDTLLAPVDPRDSTRMSSIPELISDHSSPEDMEIDFTYSFKATTQAHRIHKADKCGFCEDGGKCICAEAEAEISMPMPQTVPLTPVNKTVKPGTCLQCQQNPEQKAYCESLARARAASRGNAEGEPAAKRSRLTQQNVQVSCADAYALYKRYSANSQAPSYDEIYQEYVKSHPATRRGTATVNLGSDPKTRQFSAYETDMAAVIATLHRQGTNSSTSSGGQRSSESAKT
jgi:hypothetical protein